MLKKQYRIIKNKDFQDILKKGRFIRNPLFTLKYKKTFKDSRFAFIVSKKVSKNAPIRNLIKRRLREIIRSELIDIKSGYDIIFIMKPNASNVSFSSLKKEVLKSLVESRLKIKIKQ